MDRIFTVFYLPDPRTKYDFGQKCPVREIPQNFIKGHLF
jgi:hypothetical protein